MVEQIRAAESNPDIIQRSADVKKKKRRAKEPIISKISTKVQAAIKMVKDIGAGQYIIYDDMWLSPITGKIEERPFIFDQKGLLQKEVDFYKQTSTPWGVLQTLDYYVKEEGKRPYELFPTVHFSEDQIQGN